MGRKINPFGYRLGVIYDWKSRWFAKKGVQYSELLAEDYRLRKFIRAKVGQAGVAKIGIERFPNQVIVTIFTAKPGIIIGRKGAAVKELRESIEKQTGKKVKLEISEIEKPDLEAQLVAENIAGQIERKFRDVIGISAKIKLVAPESLQLTEGMFPKVVDRRKK